MPRSSTPPRLVSRALLVSALAALSLTAFAADGDKDKPKAIPWKLEFWHNQYDCNYKIKDDGLFYGADITRGGEGGFGNNCMQVYGQDDPFKEDGVIAMRVTGWDDDCAIALWANHGYMPPCSDSLPYPDSDYMFQPPDAVLTTNSPGAQLISKEDGTAYRCISPLYDHLKSGQKLGFVAYSCGGNKTLLETEHNATYNVPDSPEWSSFLKTLTAATSTTDTDTATDTTATETTPTETTPTKTTPTETTPTKTAGDDDKTRIKTTDTHKTVPATTFTTHTIPKFESSTDTGDGGACGPVTVYITHTLYGGTPTTTTTDGGDGDTKPTAGGDKTDTTDTAATPTTTTKADDGHFKCIQPGENCAGPSGKGGDKKTDTTTTTTDGDCAGGKPTTLYSTRTVYKPVKGGETETDTTGETVPTTTTTTNTDDNDTVPTTTTTAAATTTTTTAGGGDPGDGEEDEIPDYGDWSEWD
ncbi:hypothetical protein B0H66DRAFT_614361 [Apodospora peruviana]|uniref:Uncharacterized protein n=1 Tax=Apodospora peruviana TaxID=516989 RepID=A0AAE0LY78_9PEZI|nr:hypothetical protein B0H66DRAFT_614361 [Apodospora peruviana]